MVKRRAFLSKRQEGAKAAKGAKGFIYIYPFGLFGPLGLFGPFSVAVAWNKRNRHKHTGHHNPISQEKAAYTTLGKNATDG